MTKVQSYLAEAIEYVEWVTRHYGGDNAEWLGNAKKALADELEAKHETG